MRRTEDHARENWRACSVGILLGMLLLAGQQVCCQKTGETPRQRLEQLLAQLPNDAGWTGYDLPSVQLLAARVDADNALKKEVIAQLQSQKTLNDRAERLVGLAGCLSGKEMQNALSSLLEKSDLELKRVVLSRMMVKNIPAPRDTMMSLVGSSDEPLAYAAAQMSLLWYPNDTALFLKMAQSPIRLVRDTAYASRSYVVQEALLPLAVERLKSLRADTEIKEGVALFIFVSRYDHTFDEAESLPPMNAVERDAWLRVHERLQKERDACRAMLNGPRPAQRGASEDKREE